MKISNIIIHCSDSRFGSASLVEKWHNERGFNGIGYHFVILNGKVNSRNYFCSLDGSVEPGRSTDVQGAHCEGNNHNSIGICLIGKDQFTGAQVDSLLRLCAELLQIYGLSPAAVIGHCETDSGRLQGKTCPNFDVSLIRKKLEVKNA